jgi:hypothetical protein
MREGGNVGILQENEYEKTTTHGNRQQNATIIKDIVLEEFLQLLKEK